MASDPPGQSDELEGTLDKIVFHNPTSAWTVARLDTGDGTPVTVVGALTGLTPGTPLALRGAWVDDPKFGRQFKVASYHTRAPETLLGIERYLGSGLIPGVGPELAKRLVTRFGQDTLKVIDHQPERLVEVDGIGPARVASIAAAWREQREIQDVMIFLRGLGISSAFAVRIFKRYGADAIARIRQNPYRLALDVWGIGFRTADSIARALGLASDAPERLEAGLVHVIGELHEDGHLHAPQEVVLPKTAELLAIAEDRLTGPLAGLLLGRSVVREELGGRPCLALADLWRAEVEAARALADLVRAPAVALAVDVAATVAELEARAGIALAAEQRKAVFAAAHDKCLVITGGPGVGKTTIVRTVVALLAAGKLKVALAAPTGRAAKRLGESTGQPASTLHRLLEFQPRTGSFARNAELPLEADAVIVDEASMIDIGLLRALLVALPASARLILVGDVDQLPSVGPGAVLADVIGSGAATVVRLVEIFRQAAASRIVTSAHQINRGELPELGAPPGATPARSDFYFIERDDPAAAVATLVELCAERIPSRFGFDPLTEVQVLAPMHRGELGTLHLNQVLQARLNPRREGATELVRGERVFRAGDKVMQLKNDHEREVYNGDVGVIRTLDGDHLTVELTDGRVIEYAIAQVDELGHAFAMSVHKSQGSEYPAVVLPLHTQHYLMLQRNLLYTAITRGKQLVVVVGSARAVAMAVRNHASQSRWTWLGQRVREALAAA